jgi:hypothetical protein
MAIWIGILLHVIGIEFYVRVKLSIGFGCGLIRNFQLRKSESKNAVRVHGQFVLGPMDKEEGDST